MRVRQHAADETKVELQMTPMIDVVFQLLIFFLFTFKIRPIEGEIAVSLPPVEAGAARQEEEITPAERVHVRLEAGVGGQLANIVVEDQAIGTDLDALRQLLTAAFPGGPGEDAEVEVDADDQLLYGHVIRVAGVILQSGVKKILFTDRPTRR